MDLCCEVIHILGYAMECSRLNVSEFLLDSFVSYCAGDHVIVNGDISFKFLGEDSHGFFVLCYS